MTNIDLIGVKADQYGTVRYTIWPGDLAKLILTWGIPEGFKKGDRVKLGAFNISPTISQQLLKHIADDLMIARTYDAYVNIQANHHWLMQEGGLWDDRVKEWLTW